MTWSDAIRRRVLCGTAYDTVLALGGSASYLSPAELSELRARSNRGVLLMHYAPGQQPITDDLDSASAAASLAVATDAATEQSRVGRFIASFVPARPAESGVPVRPPR